MSIKSSISSEVIQARKTHFLACCKKNGLRITHQKEVIYNLLSQTEDHPTAQQLFTEVKKQIPSVSFATVYKNLLLFTKHDLIQELDFGEGYSRYDARVTEHHHVYNSVEKTVKDIESGNYPLPKELEGKDIKKVQITYFV